MAPLHSINPVRLRFILDCLYRHFQRDGANDLPLSDLRILDIGCGGGLVCEPLARLGASVSGIDPAENVTRTASEHAKFSNLNIHYRAITAEECLKHNLSYDVVLALEVVEHVDHLEKFLDATTKLVAQKGLIFYSTLNRTRKSFLLAIMMAEHVLRWLEPGTHHWQKFITPDELTQHLSRLQFSVKHQTGLVYKPLSDYFTLDKKNLSVNYMFCAEHADQNKLDFA